MTLSVYARYLVAGPNSKLPESDAVTVSPDAFGSEA